MSERRDLGSGPVAKEAVTMEDYTEPKGWKELREIVHDLKAPIEAQYAADVGPALRRKKEALADLEREYAERLRTAKADLRAAQKTYRDVTAALSKWRRSTAGAIETEYRALQRPAGVKRSRAVRPIDTWREIQAKRLSDAGVPWE